MPEQIKHQNSPLIPSETLISEILTRLNKLKAIKEKFGQTAWPSYIKKKTTKTAMNITELINVASEFGVSLSKEEVIKLFPNFDQISSLVTLDNIREQTKIPCIHIRIPPPPAGEESLRNFVDYVESALKQKIETAQGEWWDKHVRPLIDEIELELFPYWPYFIHYGTWRGMERTFIRMTIESRELEKLSEVIKEFEKFKHMSANLKASGQNVDVIDKQETQPLAILNEGEWSNAMSKKEIIAVLGLGSYSKLNTFSKNHPLKQAGNRQLWQIRIDDMDKNMRQKFKKA
ncbi:MAG: hypothetical protein A2Y12_09855 [Planctomycetes bacterium GWF2_42_9]|nr:MAG: hypothetical protein A2Y12_09855 [Planctomycetes bacterium GWF2_42_9]